MTKRTVPPEDRAKIPRISDVTALHNVEIRVNNAGSVIWINVDDVCVLRIQPQATVSLSIRDERKRPQSKPLPEPTVGHSSVPPWERPANFRTDKDD